jgi:hypothetical protein
MIKIIIFDKLTIEKLWYAQTYMGYSEFYDCFKNLQDSYNNKFGISMHLWKKYKDYHYNILRLWNGLDLINQRKLLKYLNSDEFQEKFYKNHQKYMEEIK